MNGTKKMEGKLREYNNGSDKSHHRLHQHNHD
uniref:Uncharacterized protein n=1 Tax=Arundo donax TaxID=35708 RepID=A0A0A9CLA0_ARUDO